MAVTALGRPEEPSKADLLRALQQLQDQMLAGIAELHRKLDAMADPPSPGRTAEPLPPGLDEMPPMRGFLNDDSD